MSLIKSIAHLHLIRTPPFSKDLDLCDSIYSQCPAAVTVCSACVFNESSSNSNLPISLEKEYYNEALNNCSKNYELSE